MTFGRKVSAFGRRPDADLHEAAVGPGDWRWLEWPRYEVLRPQESREAVRVAQATASLQPEITARTLN